MAVVSTFSDGSSSLRQGRGASIPKWDTLPPINMEPGTGVPLKGNWFSKTPVRFYVSWWEGTRFLDIVQRKQRPTLGAKAGPFKQTEFLDQRGSRLVSRGLKSVFGNKHAGPSIVTWALFSPKTCP